jgi:hypothetical protein
MTIDDMWTDWVIWENLADAENAMTKSYENASAIAFTSMIDKITDQGVYPLERSY